MGLLIEGKWHDQWYDTDASGGEFVREGSSFRNWVTRDGSPGPTGDGGFRAEAGRYHLYVALACPWASRALILRRLKGLQDVIGVSVVHPDMLENGWEFREEGFAGVETQDDLYGARYMHELYTRARPDYSGRVTVPVLWDRETETIVNNESADIIRMLNDAFEGIGAGGPDYYPADLRAEIDAVNATVYENVNNGVYRAGFATTQAAYEKAFVHLFDTLDELEQRLDGQRYLVGEHLTEADWRLFTTLVRFDAVYVGHFKCNLRRIADYPNLSNYLRDLYQVPGVAETVNMAHIKRHYYYSHATINPTRVVPRGPEQDFDAPHDRARLSGE